MKSIVLKRASIACMVLWIVQAGITTEEYEAGIDYHVLDIQEDTEADDSTSDASEKISVIEYFSYGCLACKKFEVHISSWLENKADDVEFKREAVVFQESWALLAKAYYTAVELDVLEAVHIPMFEAIHEDKRAMHEPKNIEQLFKQEAQIDSKVFRETFYEDTAIVDQILKIHERAQSMRIKNTPTVVVDGKYLVNTRTAQSRKRIFLIVDFLTDKVRAERQSVSTNEQVLPSNPPVL
ncbi:MAG: thiol:disulfide interchange protein DsbA/DsbL [Gammaproteobacteria bacterium]|nr:thiol:disulfide interchange protein DsbA/DsbL [Gammaproteobacteria bacterium]MYF02713.1 thiol:disulfide interchange protein DsbA/DsbL [Gammaproteobacteria bacterium]MYI77022.1 thiol:disulfide interchange protein DsbA/DsbL [Gammaproteobacteria bacterium]